MSISTQDLNLANYTSKTLFQKNIQSGVIAKIVDEFGNVQGADASAVAKQAEAFFNKLSGDGAISPGLAVRQLQAWEQAARTG